MKTLLVFATFSLAVCLALCLNENQMENDEEEVFEEILDREKRDAMPKPKGMHLFLISLSSIHDECHACHEKKWE